MNNNKGNENKKWIWPTIIIGIVIISGLTKINIFKFGIVPIIIISLIFNKYKNLNQERDNESNNPFRQAIDNVNKTIFNTHYSNQIDRLVMELREKFPKARFIKNAKLTSANNLEKMFKIDLIMFSQKGVFVLNVIDFSGAVNGAINSLHWTVRNEYGRAINVSNPFLENSNHIKELNDLFRFQYQGAVIMSQQTNLNFEHEGLSITSFIERLKELDDSYYDFELNECYDYLLSKINNNKYK